MTEEEFDSLMRARPFGTEDARQAEAQMLRSTALLTTLGTALWGKTEDDLNRRLHTPYPAIPAGFGLRDFQDLLHACTQIVSVISAVRKMEGLRTSPNIVVHAQRHAMWEDRCEIVRRAIEHLEKS